MGVPVRAGCLGEEAEKKAKGQRQGENLAFRPRPAKLVGKIKTSENFGLVLLSSLN